jgi:hypothetical protein
MSCKSTKKAFLGSNYPKSQQQVINHRKTQLKGNKEKRQNDIPENQQAPQTA